MSSIHSVVHACDEKILDAGTSRRAPDYRLYE
jgi:hypothetical protein